MAFTFHKEERLCSRRLIDSLYAEGHRLMAFPYSVQWLETNKEKGNPVCQVLIVAPKRRFHHAVDRNRVKRLTRECWRQLKPSLYTFLQEHNTSIALSLVYVHTEIFTYEQMLHKMERLISSLRDDILKSLDHEAV